MHDPGGTWEIDKDYKVFDKPDESGHIGMCKHCLKTFKNTNSLRYEHKMHCPKRIAQKDDTKQGKITVFLQEKQQKQEETKVRKIVNFICENSISINATQKK